MESRTTKLEVVIPPDVAFSDLNLQHDPNSGGIVFEYQPIERICEASGIDVDHLAEECEDDLGDFLMSWYLKHRAYGGEPDYVADSIIEEMKLIEAAGQRFTLPAGHA